MTNDCAAEHDGDDETRAARALCADAALCEHAIALLRDAWGARAGTMPGMRPWEVTRESSARRRRRRRRPMDNTLHIATPRFPLGTTVRHALAGGSFFLGATRCEPPCPPVAAPPPPLCRGGELPGTVRGESLLTTTNHRRLRGSVQPPQTTSTSKTTGP